MKLKLLKVAINVEVIEIGALVCLFDHVLELNFVSPGIFVSVWLFTSSKLKFNDH